MKLKWKFDCLTLFPLLLLMAYNAEAQFINNTVDSILLADAKWRTYAACCMDTVFLSQGAQQRTGQNYYLFCELDLQKCYPDKQVALQTKKTTWYHFGDRMITLHSTPLLCVSLLKENISGDDLILTTGSNKSMLLPHLGYSDMIIGQPTHMFLDGGCYELIPEKFFDECRLKRLMEIVTDPIQPEVIRFVRENKAILNPWFLSEAIHRGLFDSTKYSPELIDSAIIRKQRSNGCYTEERRIKLHK